MIQAAEEKIPEIDHTYSSDTESKNLKGLTSAQQQQQLHQKRPQNPEVGQQATEKDGNNMGKGTRNYKHGDKGDSRSSKMSK